MKLSKTSAHAALAVAYLAGLPSDTPIQARQIAEHLGIPTDSALKILQAMVRQRIIQSQLGRAGGYMLTRPAQQVTLLEIVEAIDGPISAALPIRADQGAKSIGLEKLSRICENVAERLRAELTRFSVADLTPDTATLRVAG